MSRYGLMTKFIAAPSQRDALAALLLEAASGLQGAHGCEQYIVGVSESEPDAVWVSEIWVDKVAYDASLTLPETQATIACGRPLIAGVGERIEYTPLNR